MDKRLKKNMTDSAENHMEELLPLVAQLAQSYTGYESTSVTYEKAQMFMEAVCYCLEEYEHSATGGSVRRDISIREKYELGYQLVTEKAKKTAVLMNELAQGFEDYGVRCLYDTVCVAVPEFLKWYDARFCPQETMITLDYPLLDDMGCPDAKGVDAVYGYMLGIQAEQRFLRRFDTDYVLEVLMLYDAEYREMMDNICAIMLADMIGHSILQKPFDQPGFQRAEYRKLSECFSGKSADALAGMFRQLTRQIVRQYYEADEAVASYLCAGIQNLAVRTGHAVRQGHLEQVFVRKESRKIHM